MAAGCTGTPTITEVGANPTILVIHCPACNDTWTTPKG